MGFTPNGFFSCIHEIKPDVRDLGNRLNHVDDQMGEYFTFFNTLVDAHKAQKDDLIKNNLADLEDRSRRNNQKIHGIPETGSSSQLPHYVCDLFQVAVPSLTSADLTIDRIHRFPKPPFLPAHVLRDVLLCVHYQAKEKLLDVIHKKERLSVQAAGIQVLPDLSVHTLH